MFNTTKEISELIRGIINATSVVQLTFEQGKINSTDLKLALKTIHCNALKEVLALSHGVVNIKPSLN